MDKISVIIPVYNGQKYIQECIESVLKQEFSLEVEIIVIDDGSEDNTENICKKYLLENKNFIYFQQKNLGRSIARNKGIALANGELITFLDSDDYLEKNMLLELYECYEKYKVDIVNSGFIYTSSKKNREILPVYHGRDREFRIEQLHGYVTNKLFNLNFIKKNNIFFPINCSKGEDFAFMFKLMTCSPNIYTIRKSYYHYRIHDNNTIGNMKLRLSSRVAFADCYDFLKARLIKDKKMYQVLEKEFNNEMLRDTVMISNNLLYNESDFNAYKNEIFSCIQNADFLTKITQKIIKLKIICIVFILRKCRCYKIIYRVKNIK